MQRMRRFVGSSALLLSVTLAFWLSGCAPSAQQPAGTPAQPQATEEQPQYGGTLRFGGLSAPRTMDILAGTASTGEGRAGNPIYEPLVIDDFTDPNFLPDLKRIPHLAERWEISPDGLGLTFYLRKGVKWHDGEEFTAADVLYSWKRIDDEKGTLASRLKSVTKMEAPDPYTVKLLTSERDVNFLIGLGGGNMVIMPKHAADKGVDFTKVAIGTGPFKLQSFDNKSSNVLVRNENYWQKGMPYIDRLELIWSLDKSALLAALAARQVDTSFAVTKTDLQTVQKAAPDVQVIKRPLISNTDLYFNIEHPIFKDPRVRRAIHLVLDRQEFVKITAQGDGFISCFLPGGVRWCLPDLEQLPGFRQPKAQDIAEAKRLLAEAGYANGFEFAFLYNTNNTQAQPLAELFATQLTPVGVKTKLDGRDGATFTDLSTKGTFDAALIAITAPGGTSFYDYYHSKGTRNTHHISNADMDRLLEQQTQTFDPAERQKVWYDIQRKMLENNWSIPFIDPIVYGVVQPWVKGPTVLNDTWIRAEASRWATTWLDQKIMPKR